MISVKNNQQAIKLQTKKIKILKKALDHAKATLSFDRALIKKGYKIKAINLHKLF